jgi:carbon starvation protein
MPSIILSSAIVVSCWGYFLYIGVIDPNGGVNILWPLFGIANQMLAAIALSVGTGILIKSNKLKYAWVTGLPLIWLIIVTTTAAYQKIFSQDIRVGFIASARDLTEKINAGLIEDSKISITYQLIFNQKLDAFITLFLLIILWTVVVDMLRISFFKKN